MHEAAAERARPILTTTLAMATGMAPAAFGTGDGGFRAPMEIAVIGGLAASTILSLVVVPTLHCLVADAGTQFGRLWSRFTPSTKHQRAEALEQTS
ncbi:efflux RND transporter permease subunit [Aureimonas pseudogalii]|uniref:Multidrug efflux pump subunit AcrB n=1 Tax=Aureimonas pseudogalii TaxID=1744844 RepID=A0A7W6MME4_9HYPH|nr:multidrug efflux pump subunit AcrB [Aureimonas pseudogalii]